MSSPPLSNRWVQGRVWFSSPTPDRSRNKNTNSNVPVQHLAAVVRTPQPRRPGDRRDTQAEHGQHPEPAAESRDGSRGEPRRGGERVHSADGLSLSRDLRNYLMWSVEDVAGEREVGWRCQILQARMSRHHHFGMQKRGRKREERREREGETGRYILHPYHPDYH
ncbi:hypothetical protein VTI74DRAFT_8972 [Chaetomium olivicolor]